MRTRFGATNDTNIKLESYNQYKSLFNMDSFKDIYKFYALVEHENFKVRQSYLVVLDFNNPFLDMNRHFLLTRCDITEMNNRWKNRPGYLSYDKYGTQSFAYLLMFVNDAISILDFDFDYVRIPRMSAIKELIINNQRQFPDRSSIKDVRFF